MRFGRLIRAGVGLTLLSPLLVGTGGLRSDDLACEQAMVALDECCAGFSPRGFDCAYGEGCDGESFPPIVLRPESGCIRRLSCEDVRASRICERVVARRDLIDAGQFDSALDAARASPVCP